MNLICKLSDPEVWAAFYAYKIEGGHLSRQEQTDLAAELKKLAGI
jgi:hypothetical protein